jgi:bis(5'-adenosyl)-triphosphatase
MRGEALRYSGCPFCDPGIVTAVFAETPHSRAVYNRAPLVPGHSLVIPTRHVLRLADLDAEELADLFGAARTVSQILLAAYGCDGLDLSLQQGASAGQTVAHLHLHLVPRRPGDLPHDDWHAQLLDSASRPRLTPAEIAHQVVRLRALWAARPAILPPAP